MHFGPPNFWILLAIIVFAFGLGWLAKVLSKDPNPYLTGAEYALGQLFLYARQVHQPEDLFERLKAEAADDIDLSKHSRAFNQGMRDALQFYGRLEDQGILALEELQAHLNYMVSSGDCSLAEVSVALDVIDQRIGVGFPTQLAQEPAHES